MSKMTLELIARCRAKARANNTSVEQEVFLAAGGRLKDWYESGTHRPAMFGFPSDGTDAEMAEFADTEVARSRAFAASLQFRAKEPKGGSTELESARSVVIAARMKCALLPKLGRPLTEKEDHALRAAADYIALEPNGPAQVALEAYSVQRAIELVNG